MAGAYLKTVSLQLAAAAATGYALSQTGTAGTPLTLAGSLVSGGVGVADVGRRVIITPAGDEHTNAFTIVGTTNNGTKVTEVVQGTNTPTVAASLTNFKTVTSITPTNNTAAAVTAGTNGVGSTDPAVVDYFAGPVELGMTIAGDGSTNYTIEIATDDVWPDYDIYTKPPTWTPATGFSGVTTSPLFGRIQGPLTLWRLTVNSGTGKITAKGAQSLIAGGA